ncbi:MAG: L,D-transpeptidase [Chloroflexia bacterium]
MKSGKEGSLGMWRKTKSVMWALSLLSLVAVSTLGIWGGTAQAQAQDVPRFPLRSTVATTVNTNLVEQPLAGGAVIVALPINTQAVVLGGPFNEDGYYWLDYNGTTGYVSGKQLALVDGNWRPIIETTPTPVATPTPDVTTPTTQGDYSGLWLGEMSGQGNVRSGPGRDQKVIKGWWVGRRVLLYQSATDGGGELWYRVSDPPEAPMWVHSSLINRVAPVKYDGPKYKGKWIGINISQQIVTAYVDGTPVKVTLASTGTIKTLKNGVRQDNRTELGVWKIYYRLPKQDMDGGSLATGDYYNLKDVPYPQYFHNSGEALHGTYWHDDFGRPHSHGCVNLSTPMSEWFYGWARVGTVVWVHN